MHHLDALCDVGLDPVLWTWTLSHAESPAQMETYIKSALSLQKTGSALPFVIIDAASNKVVGSTRYGNIEMAHKRLEIGWTWIAKPWQRTRINTEMKLLMLSYAFDTLGCNRVELKTDALNAQSRTAITRIGGVEEGTLRHHSITDRGRVRDTVYFSIIRDEWPAVKARLEEKLA